MTWAVYSFIGCPTHVRSRGGRYCPSQVAGATGVLTSKG
jgi:hypothetical protein